LAALRKKVRQNGGFSGYSGRAIPPWLSGRLAARLLR